MIPGKANEVVPDAVRSQLRLPKVGQIGYVVNNIHKAIAYYKNALGISPWLLLDERPDPCIQRGETVYPLLRIGLSYVGSVQIELIQVAEGQSVHLSHLKEPEGRIHHLGFMVQDIDKRLQDYQSVGIDVLQLGVIRESGITVKYAYLDVVDKAGTIFELVQWRLGLLPLPTSRPVFNLACSLGSRTVFKGRVIR
jgi:catechol 2,3-dioxygenase-like lactoylglutathione lyase family enzyme